MKWYTEKEIRIQFLFIKIIAKSLSFKGEDRQKSYVNGGFKVTNNSSPYIDCYVKHIWAEEIKIVSSIYGSIQIISLYKMTYTIKNTHT